MNDQNNEDMITVTADIVSAFVSNNSVRAEDLSALIESVHQAIKSLSEHKTDVAVAPPPVPAVSIKKSVTDDYLICLEDGKRFKSLKRHLSTSYGMSPDDYRAKWGLPRDYPMVAPGYAASRSKLAKDMGLGKKLVQLPPAVEEVAPIAHREPDVAAAPQKAAAKRTKTAAAVKDAAPAPEEAPVKRRGRPSKKAA
ncbi:MucR family transcriptional regulator [Lichenihabitans psoromatis]|uniref:MucR family transcriptional regulator n=1 Tax=Lichenihabitans psoromatis TaxID=2528642 RepID=UPI00103623F7|nr:MucR family transcriptional regulator [Lichenihabitans psoromatis]